LVSSQPALQNPRGKHLTQIQNIHIFTPEFSSKGKNKRRSKLNCILANTCPFSLVTIFDLVLLFCVRDRKSVAYAIFNIY